MPTDRRRPAPRRRVGRRDRASGGLGMLRLLVVPVMLGATAALVGCGNADPAEDGRTLVVATTTQLADFARVVGGDDVEVYGLLRPNVDAHDFEPSPADLDALFHADVILENGLGLEPWLDATVEAADATAEVVDTSEGAHLLAAGHGDDAHTPDDGHDHDHGTWNPHLWFDPRNARVMADHTADAIVAAVGGEGTAAGAAVRARAGRYDRELARLDTWIRDRLAPLEDRRLVTDHDAFPYYVERYDLVFVGSVIPGFDSSAELSASDLDDLAGRIEATGARAVFTEQSLPTRAAEALARRTGVQVVSGDDGLYGDSLGPEGSAGATYLSMMRHNTDSIAEHLGGGRT